MLARRNIGIICNWQPIPVKCGSNQRLIEMILFLRSKNYCVHLIVIEAKYKNKELSKYVDSVHYFFNSRNTPVKIKSIYWLLGDWLAKIGYPHINDIVLRIKSFLKKKPPSSNYWTVCSPKLAEFVAKTAEFCHWDAVIVEYIWLYQSVTMLPKKVFKFVDTHDVMHIRFKEIEKIGGEFPFKITESEEAALLNYFDCIIAIQEAEKKIFYEIRNKYNMTFDIIKVGVSVSVSINFKNCSSAKNENNIILFVGGYNELNIFGLKNFLSNIWNKLYNLYPSFRFVVCGNVCNAFSNNIYPGVDFLGYAANLREIYDNSLLVVNPIWMGTGLKVKTIEAIAYGKPLVTTLCGIEGLDNEISDACIVAENEDVFLDKLVYLIEHPKERELLSIRASKFYQKHLSFESTYKELENYLNFLIKSKHRLDLS